MKLFVSVASIFLAAAAAAAQDDGELRWYIHADPRTFDPLLAAEEASETVSYLTRGVLIRWNRNTLELQPELASAWKVVEGGRRVDLTLRSNVRFSDGTPLRAEDVVASIHRLNERGLRSAVADTFRDAAGEISAAIRGPLQVSVSFSTPRAGLEQLFDQLPISPAHAQGARSAVLGPYVVAEYEPGVHVLLRRNPHYWKRDAQGRRLPVIDTIRLLPQSNRDTELLRFRRGEIDFVSKIEPEAFERLRREMPEAVRDAGPSLNSEFFWFNQKPDSGLPLHKQRWFQSKAFRQAISLSVNRQDILRLVYLGHAAAAKGPISPANRLWHNSLIREPRYDRAGALKLLEAAGFRFDGRTLHDQDGNAVEFSLITNADSRTRTRMGAMVQQDLAKIGIRVSFTPLEFQSLVERITRTQQYEACLLGLSGMEIDPNGQMNVWLSSGTHHAWNPRQTAPATEWEAEIDRLVKLQATSTSLKERRAAVARVQEIFAEQVPIIYLIHPDLLVGVSRRIKGVAPSALPPHLFWNIEHLSMEPRASGRRY